MTRYALYFAPGRDSGLWQAASSWLGRDAAADMPVAQPAPGKISAATLAALIDATRRYGFHATLKAPFRLSAQSSIGCLLEQVERLARLQHTFPLPPLEVTQLRNFLALAPVRSDPRIAQIANICLTQFDRHRAPLTQIELERRRQQPLTRREDGLLQTWGYPYVLDSYRFHFSLTDSLCGMHSGFIAKARRCAERAFGAACREPQLFDAISIFRESVPGADFHLLHRAPFGRQGRLLYVVGPSGAGKDSIIDWAQQHQGSGNNVVFVRRTITRPGDAGGERHHGVSAEAFVAMRARGEFSMAWEAHGLSYGIPNSIRADLQRGMTVVINGSRAYLPQAAADFPHIEVVHITAASAILQRRLRSRARESGSDLALREMRPLLEHVRGLTVMEIHNDGELFRAGEAFLQILQRPAIACSQAQLPRAEVCF